MAKLCPCICATYRRECVRNVGHMFVKFVLASPHMYAKKSASIPPKKSIISGYIVRLQELSERLVEFIESPQQRSLLNWEEPMILRKVGE